MEGLLAVVGLEVTTEGVRTGTGTERWRERVPDFRGHLSQPAINFSLFTKPSELSANESFFFQNLKPPHLFSWTQKMLRKGIFVYVCCKKCSLYSSVPVEESDRMTEDRDKWRKYVRGVASGHPSDRGRLKNRTEQNRTATRWTIFAPSRFTPLTKRLAAATAAAAWGSAGESAAAACRYVADNDIDELNDLRARTPSPPPPLLLQFCIDFSATRLSRLDNTSSFDRQHLSGRRHELAVSDACAVRRDDVTTPRDRSFAALGRRQTTGHAVIAAAAAAACRHGVCGVVLTRLIIA